jgi:hypothetical protein
MQTNNGVIRTKMSAALIGAVHNSINSGHNTGKLGRLVLTAEAKGVGVKYAPYAKDGSRSSLLRTAPRQQQRKVDHV